MTEPVARRTSPLVVLVHTITFRQARQFVPAVIPVVAAVGLGGGTTTIVALVLGVTLLSLATAALSWWRFSYADGPASVVVTRGLLSRSVRTVPNDRIRGVEVEAPVAAPAVRAGPRPHRRGRRHDDRQGRGAGRRRRPPRRGRPAAGRRPHPPARPRHRTAPSTSPSRPRRSSAASTTGGCSTRPWSAATWPSPWPRSARCSAWPQELPENLRPELDGPALSGLQVLLVVVGGVAARPARRLGGRAPPS